MPSFERPAAWDDADVCRLKLQTDKWKTEKVVPIGPTVQTSPEVQVEVGVFSA